MKIDFANLNKSYLQSKNEIDQSIREVINSSSFIMGDEVRNLEKNLSNFVECKYVITCSSGTDALLISLMSLNINVGDEVITTPYSFISTAEVISFLGAKPVFVDINKNTFNIDENKIEEKITKKTKAIIPVSLFGQTSNMEKINKIASHYNIDVIEDAAQSFGAKHRNNSSCNLSKIGCTSFFPAKPLGCFGDGGAVFTNNKKLSKILDSLRLHGKSEKKYYHDRIGVAGRLDTIQATILNVKLKKYNSDIKKRNDVAKKYSEILLGNFELPFVEEYNRSVWAQYTLKVSNRKNFIHKLNSVGIPINIYYPEPLHLQKCFKYLNYKRGDFPISENISKSAFSIPMNPYLNDNEIDYICSNLIKHNKK